MDSLVRLIHHDPDRSWITNPQIQITLHPKTVVDFLGNMFPSPQGTLNDQIQMALQDIQGIHVTKHSSKDSRK